ncbi:alpha-1B adrenergic receptor-like [Montipora capricornis]|uniref:alpha-1B adrenergic receptor-like n=1 Tax=Montipora capricornis TaxID=246305 RepID=UPI0035F136EF
MKGNCTGPDWEDQQIAFTSIASAFIIASACGTSMLLRAFWKFSNLRTASNMIVMSLCVADSLIPISFILQIISTEIKHRSNNGRIHSRNFCKASGLFSLFLTTVIILHLALISVDRFIAVRFSLRYHAILTNRRTLIASIAMWLWAALVTLVFPQAIWLRNNDNEALRKLVPAFYPCLRLCIRSGEKERKLTPLPSETTEAYTVFFLLTILGIPLVTILCSYIYIFRVSHNHRKQIRTRYNNPRISTITQELKGARILAIMVALCLLSFLPLFLFSSLRIADWLPDDRRKKGDNFSYRKLMKQIKTYAYIFALGLNAICNPLVYGLGNQQLRSAIRRLLKRTSVISPA